MSDDLVKRLREDQPVTQDMGSTMQCALQDAAADRIEALVVKLAKALKALDAIRLYSTDGDACRKARMTIAELTGGKDE